MTEQECRNIIGSCRLFLTPQGIRVPGSVSDRIGPIIKENRPLFIECLEKYHKDPAFVQEFYPCELGFYGELQYSPALSQMLEDLMFENDGKYIEELILRNRDGIKELLQKEKEEKREREKELDKETEEDRRKMKDKLENDEEFRDEEAVAYCGMTWNELSEERKEELTNVLIMSAPFFPWDD